MKKVVLPIAIVLIGFAVAAVLIASGPKLEPQPADTLAPLVRVVEARPQTLQLSARTYGTVVPRTESELIPEVDGRVVSVSPQLVAGGFFNAGDVLLQIETVDYDVALEQARAGLARSNSELENATRTLARQRSLKTRGATSDAERDDAQNRVTVAEATVREAEARLSRARRDLARTRIIAPYDGRVRSEQVDVGQFVKRGTAVGSIYAVDFAEVRLPIQDEELAFLNLPLTRADPAAPASPVILRARFAGQQHSWEGQVVRTEGELDPATRMVNIVARVPAPYAVEGDRPPLAVGLFVDAEIMGNTVPNLVRLPRTALRAGGRVLIVDDESRLRFRAVTVLRGDQDEVLISEGLSAGEWVCVSPLQSTADGMRVRVADEPAPAVATMRREAPAS
jgi:RND family efflux transporter MFP subunit